MSQEKILVVDDEELNFMLIENALKKDFELHYVDSGQKAFDYLKDNEVATILLDVKMPEMNGYEVCQKLKEDMDTKDIPVIFVSGLESTEERMAGYEAGGDDYIVKPFQADELLRKVQLSVSNRQQMATLKKQSNNATSAVMSALTNTGELGVVVNFYTRSFTSMDFDVLAQNLSTALGEYGLNAAIQIRPDENTYLDYDTQGLVKPLESSLLLKLKDAQRIYDFQSRTIFNYPYISILIKNMPIDDPDKYGRYKDNLAMLFEGANARVIALNAANSLEEMLDTTKDALQEMDKNNHEHKVASTRIFEDLVVQVEETILTADLTEEQEQTLLGLVTDTSNKMNDLYDNGQALNDKLMNITLQIEQKINPK